MVSAIKTKNMDKYAIDCKMLIMVKITVYITKKSLPV